MLVRSGCVGPHYVVPAFGGGEGWVGRPLDALADALSAQKLTGIRKVLPLYQQIVHSGPKKKPNGLAVMRTTPHGAWRVGDVSTSTGQSDNDDSAS